MVNKIGLLLLGLSVVIGTGGCYIEPAPYGFYTYPYGSFSIHPRPYRYYQPYKYYRPYRHHHPRHYHYHG